MKKIYNTFLLLCLGLSFSFAQDNLIISVTPDEVALDAGETITLDIEVANFNELLSMQFNLNWDPAVLEYVSTDDILSVQDLPGFTTNSIGNTAANTDMGTVAVVWLDFATVQPYSLPDNTVLFSLTLRAIEDGDGSITLNNFEVFDGDENNISVTANESTITVGEGGGGANDNPVRVTVEDGSGDSGQQVCLPVRVSNFEDMQTLQFSMAYDDALLEFAQVENFGLPDLGNGNFGTATDGEITLSWSNMGGDSTSLGNNTRIFDICFDLIGTENATTDITIENTPLAEEAMRVDIGDVGVDGTDGTITIRGDGGGGGTSDEFRIYASEESAGEGASVCVDVQVDGFANIAGMQYSMSWNTNVIEFEEIASINGDFTGFSLNNNFGLDNTENGELRVQWNDFNFEGVTLPDETVIYQICFNLVGTAGQSSDVAFTNSPVNQEVLNTDTQEVPFMSTDGSVRITGDPPPPSDCDANATPMCVSKETAGVGEEACVVVTAQNFEDISSMQFTMTFEDDIVHFERIIIPEDNPLGLSEEGNFGIPSSSAGIIAFLWSDPETRNITLPDDTELFQVCFDTRAEGTSPIAFSDVPTAREVGDNEFNQLPFEPGTGEIVVSDACAAPSVTGEVLDIACAGEESGAISLTVQGGNNNFSYSWTGGINRDTPNPTGLPAGEYTVTVSYDDNSCEATTEMTFMIEESGDPLEAEAVVEGEVLCFGEDNEVSIEINVRGGTGDYSYQWENDDIDDLDGRMNSNLPAGRYRVLVTDENDCEFLINNIQVEGPTEALAVEVALGCGDNNGSVQLNVTGGTEDYSFAWEGAEGLGDSDTQTDLEAGMYSVTITDENDCELVEEEIEVFELLNLANPTVGFIVDNDGAIDIKVEGGSGDFSFAWEGPSFTSEEEDLSGLAEEGVYIVTVTDNVTGCEVSDSYEVLANSEIGIASITTTPDCSGEDGNSGTILVEIVGGIPPFKYSWNTGQMTKDITDGNAGVAYVLTVMDMMGNMFTSESIVIGSAPMINYTLSTEPETCGDNNDNGSVSVSAVGGTGAINWDWSIDGNANQANIEGLSNGNYVVTITDNGGCMIIDTARVEYQPEAPRAIDYEITEADCGSTNGAIAFSVACGDPGYTVMVRGRNPENDTTYMFQFDTYDPRVVLDNLLPDTYDVTISDANEGSTPDVITVPAPGSMDVVGTVLSSTQVFAPCDGEIRLNLPTGSTNNYQFLWNDLDTTRNRTQLCEGTYTVTITNPQGCTQIDSFRIQTYNANGIVDNPESSAGDPTGSISLTVTAGQGPYSYMWMNSSGEMVGTDTTQNLMDIEAGVYTVKITESSGVSISRTFEVVGTTDLAAQIRFARDYGGFGVSCNGAEDAMLEVMGTSNVDTAMYEYRWLSKEKVILSDSATLIDVGPDIYEVEISALGCTISERIVVTEPDAFQVSAGEILNATCEADGEIMLITDGGGGAPYTYEWSHDAGNNFATAIGLTGGAYSYTVTDGNGCVASDSTTIEGGISISIEFETIPISANKGGTITANIFGGTPGYQYTWSNPDGNLIQTATDSTLEADKQGTYTLMVTDINGCTTIAEVNLINEDGCLESRPVITPNNDGKNETFAIRCVESYKDQRIEIYNRWGTLVYTMVGYDGSWAGQNMDGTPAPDGVYFYVLFYRDIDEVEKQQTGTVTVLTE